MNNSLENNYRALVVNCLESWFQKRVHNLSIADAVHYALFPGGKFIRSCFALSLVEDMGGDVEQVLPAVAALELLHTASLLHDDLPALDNDDMRRGKPSTHKKFDEATAVLCADYLISAAFGLLADCSLITRHHELPALFSEAFCHLCEGQLIDTTNTEEQKNILKLHQLKTGSLFRCAAGIAAQLVHEDLYLVENIKQFGLWVGVVFQITDDLIDNNPTLKGRSRHSDSANGKQTFREEDNLLQQELAVARVRKYYTSIHDNTGRDLRRVKDILMTLPQTQYRIFAEV
jgi:geranylgeranyl diphosphate synthase, type II